MDTSTETTTTAVEATAPEATGTTTEATVQQTPQAAPTETPAGVATPEVLDFSKVNIPEGVVVDDAFKAIAKEIGLTNGGTEKLLGYAKTEIYDKIQAAQAESKSKLINEWETQTRNDFPGEKLEIAKRAYQQLADENFRNFMDETGLGSNPSVVSMFYRLGALMQEGRLVMGEGHDTPANTANSMFAKSISMMGK